MRIFRRKLNLGLGLIVLAMSALVGGQSLAAELSNGLGEECEGGGAGIWHFVNNQTGGESTRGVLNVTFGGSGAVGPFTADKVSQNNQHWTIGPFVGPLNSASSNLDGRMVLSDLTCPTPTPTPTPA